MGCDRLLRSCVPLPPLPRMVQFAACRVGRSAAPVPWLLAADDLSCMLGDFLRNGMVSVAQPFKPAMVAKMINFFSNASCSFEVQ
jgi:hypothetical protein